MKKILQSTLIIGILLFAFTSNQAQVQVSIPTGTVVNQSVTDGLNPFTGGHLGRTGGITFQYTNANWPVFSDTCLYYGVGTTLTQIINGSNPNPPNTTCGNLSNLTISYGMSNLASGRLVYTGTTNYIYLYYTGGLVSATVNIELVLQFTNPVYPVGNLFVTPVTGNFQYNVTIFAYSPSNAMYVGGGQRIPAVELYDALHGASNYSICTSWNQGDFYTLKIASTANLTQVLCNGLSTGAIDVSPSGGFGSYAYSWSNGASSKSLSNIPSGLYTDTITDSKGCRAFFSYQITEPSKIDITLTKTDALCFKDSNGSISSSATGGITPYIFAWSNGDSTANLAQLTAAKYSLHLTDSNNCALDTSVTVGQPDSISLISVVQDALCYGSNNGGINLTVAGGTSPYIYSWSNDSISKDINSLVAGKYFVTLKDQHDCMLADTFTISQPDSIGVLALIQGPSCNGLENGSIQLTTTGGVAPYVYLWSIDSTTNNISGLTAGDFSVSIMDQHNCQKSFTYSVTEPEMIEHSFDVKDVSCFNGSDGKITLTVTGGTVPYTYLWSNDSTSKDIGSLVANDYSVSVSDKNGCNFTDNASVTEPDKLVIFLDKSDVLCYGGSTGSINTSVFGGIEPFTFSWNNGETTKDLANIKAADYSVVVTDFNNCSQNSSVSVYQPDSINILSQVNDVSCFGLSDGSISITPWGGLPPYSYSWSNNADTKDINGLPSGDYTLNFKDDNQCPVLVSLTVKQPDALNAGFVVGDASCYNGNNGYIKLTVSGGTEPYSYLWSNQSETSDINQLSAGTYSVAISDAHSCALNDSATVNQPGPVTSGFTHQSTEAVATFTNTSSDASYSWDFGDGFNSTDTNPVHTYNQTGGYKVCLKAFNNCDTVVSCDSVYITISTRIAISVDKNSVSIYPNPSAGSITIERISSGSSSSWKIFDQTGRIVITGMMVSGESQIKVDLSSLANGIYFLKVEVESGNPILQKIIKL